MAWMGGCLVDGGCCSEVILWARAEQDVVENGWNSGRTCLEYKVRWWDVGGTCAPPRVEGDRISSYLKFMTCALMCEAAKSSPSHYGMGVLRSRIAI
jgi:hypothetical protein